MNAEKELSDARKEIDEIDDKLVELFTKRMEVSGKIGNIKKQAGLPVFNGEREAAVKQGVVSKAVPEMQDYVARLYDEIFKLSKEYQKG